jgi:hypothetical protein
VLDPTINRDEFTPEEDKLLIELASARLRRSSDDSSEAAATASEQRSKMAGRGSKIWSDIAQHFSGRTDNHVYRRWKQLCRKYLASYMNLDPGVRGEYSHTFSFVYYIPSKRSCSRLSELPAREAAVRTCCAWTLM